MRNEKSKKKIIQVFISLTLLLLVINVVIDFLEPEFSEFNKPVVKFSDINSTFRNTLNEVGLKEEWVKVTKTTDEQRAGKKDTISQSYKINLPYSIPPIELIRELNNNFDLKSIKIISTEKKINGSCTLNLYAENVLRIRAFINRRKNIKRVEKKIGFIILGGEELSVNEIDAVIKNPYNVGIIFTPSDSMKKRSQKILKAGKEFFILVDDQINEDKYSFHKDFSKKRLRDAVINIKNDFGNSMGIFIDGKSAIFNSPAFNYINEQFVKRGRNLLRLKTYTKLVPLADNDILSLFEFYYGTLKPDKGKLFLINFDDFISLNPEIEKLRKKGFTISLPSQLL